MPELFSFLEKFFLFLINKFCRFDLKFNKNLEMKKKIKDFLFYFKKNFN